MESCCLLLKLTFDSDVVAPYQLYFVCTVQSTVLFCVCAQYYHDYHHGLMYIITPPTHSSFFALSPLLLLLCTVRLVQYGISDITTTFVSICPLLRTLVLSCNSVPPSYSLYSYCLVRLIRLYSSCTTIFGHLGVVSTDLTNQTLPRVTLHHDDPAMIQL